MDKQKSYGDNYQQVKLKHTLSKRFFIATGLVCMAVVICVVTLGLVL